MPYDVETAIEHILWDYQSVRTHGWTLYLKLIETANKLKIGDYVMAGWALQDAAVAWFNIYPCIAHYDDTQDEPYEMYYALTQLSKMGVTWQSIVAAWVKNDFEGRAWTIAVIDRMRQILWDEPFSVVWAARPEDEEIV